MIIAVDKNLGASRRLSGLPVDIIFFEKSVPLKPIVDRLKRIEVDDFSKQLSKASQIQFKLEGDLVELKDISRKTDVSVEALEKHIEERPQSGYIRVCDQLISERLLKEIDAKLEALTTKKIVTLSEASKLIEGAGIKNPQTFLNLLGYGVKWHGIEPSKAEISK
jgi:hypothetical protein